ncbi:hypothetical protein SRRS_40290 [Sporomusa rhizae]
MSEGLINDNFSLCPLFFRQPIVRSYLLKELNYSVQYCSILVSSF